MSHLLLIGKIPPPIGGVTIHVSRLLEHLDTENIDYLFYDLNQFNILSFISTFKGKKIAHLHSTNPTLQLLFVFLCKAFNCKSVITVHGNLGVHNRLNNYLEYLSIRLSDVMLFLNQKSYNIGVEFNKNSYLTTSFIPPLTQQSLSNKYQTEILEFRQRVQLLFCTNAYNFVYDIKGNEIYGILELVKVFEIHPSKGLIISDPSGKYRNFFKDKLPFFKNILFLDTNHSFYEVIKLSDCLIRYTTTDGDSVSIREALHLGVPTIASDCVDRPKNVILVKSNDIVDLTEKMLNFNIESKIENSGKSENAMELLKTIYFNI